MPKLDASLDKVSDLFYPNTTEWNIEPLENSFYPWEVDVIRRIDVSKLSQADCLVWPLSIDGSYSIKTAYHMLATEVINSSPSSSGGVAGNVEKNLEDHNSLKSQALHLESYQRFTTYKAKPGTSTNPCGRDLFTL